MAIRFDTGRIDRTSISDQGYLTADAYPTRAGIFLYMNADGTMRRELRPPEEVFKAASIATLANLAMTRDHPMQPLNQKNTREHAVGFSGQMPMQAEDKVHLSTKITVFDEASIQDVVSGTRQELSCGYFCDVEFTPGVWNGLQYDAIQKNIRYNHIALVNRGRAGPTAKVKLDAMRLDAQADVAFMVTDEEREKNSGEGAKDRVVSPHKDQGNKKDEEKIMPVKITIDTIECEVADAATAQMIKAKIDAVTKMTADLDASKKEIETLTGKMDALVADSKKKDDEIAGLKSSKLSDKEILAKADALTKVRDFGKKILGEQAKVDEMDILAIKKAVVAKTMSHVKVDEKSAEYIDAAFDTQLSLDSKSAGDGVRRAIADRAASGGSGTTAEQVRAERIKKDSTAWQSYTGAGQSK